MAYPDSIYGLMQEIKDLLSRPQATNRLTALAQSANFTLTVPAGYCIDTIYVHELGIGTIVGGLKVGTTSGATDVVTAFTITVGLFTKTAPTIAMFSATADQELFFQAVTGWGSPAASIDVVVSLQRAIP